MDLVKVEGDVVSAEFTHAHTLSLSLSLSSPFPERGKAMHNNNTSNRSVPSHHSIRFRGISLSLYIYTSAWQRNTHTHIMPRHWTPLLPLLSMPTRTPQVLWIQLCLLFSLSLSSLQLRFLPVRIPYMSELFFSLSLSLSSYTRQRETPPSPKPKSVWRRN